MLKAGLLFILGLLALTFYGCEEIFEDDLTKRTISLVAPTNGAVTNEVEHQFTWDRLNVLSAYQLQIVTPTFDSIAVLVVDTVVVDNLVRVTLSRDHQYQWRVRAINNNFSSSYSRYWTLTIQ